MFPQNKSQTSTIGGEGFIKNQVLPQFRNFQFSIPQIRGSGERERTLDKIKEKVISIVGCLIGKDRISTTPCFHKSNLKLPPLEEKAS